MSETDSFADSNPRYPSGDREKERLDACISGVDRNGIPYGLRLKRAREAAGKTPEEIASLVGVSVPSYYDWECVEGDINTTGSLGELAEVCRVLGLRVATLFDDAATGEDSVPPEELCARIRAHLDAKDMSISEFEDRVGFEVASVLVDPLQIMGWNVDCLRFVCAEIGVNWLSALP